MRRASFSDFIAFGADMLAPSKRLMGRDSWACRLEGRSLSPAMINSEKFS
jgi:hypothetical protein